MRTIFYQGENNRLGIIGVLDQNSSIEEIVSKTIPENLEYKVIEGPTNLDSDFLDAYDFINKEAVMNYERAKDIQKNKWRQLRKPILEKLDVEFMKALETGNTQKVQEIGSQKQELRDVTKTPLINNLDDIKNAMPNILLNL